MQTKDTSKKRGAAKRGLPADVDAIQVKNCRDAAQLINTVLGNNSVPPFVRDAVRRVVSEAAKRFNYDLFSNEGAFDVDNLAHLFDSPASVSSTHDLADCIARVLADKDTPSEMYNALSEAYTEFNHAREVLEAPEVVRLTLACYAEKGGAK